MPTVSVIVPYYNVQDYLDECLASLMAQTFEDFEVVLVDDGSTDASREIAKAATAVDQRFRIVFRENGGLSAARNTGLEAAKGFYIAFLDSDDYYDPTALERLVSFATTNELELVDFTATTFYDEGTGQADPEGFASRTSIPGIHTGPELFCRYQDLQQYYCSACFHLIKRNVLERTKLRFKEGIIHEDELFTPLLHAAAGRSAFLNIGLYQRRMRPASIITKPRGVKNVSSLFTITQELHAWLVEHAHEYMPEFVDAFAQRVFELRDIMAHDAYLFCSDEEINQLVNGFQGQDRADCEIYVRQGAKGIEKIYNNVRSSTSFKLGNALLALPRKLKPKH